MGIKWEHIAGRWEQFAIEAKKTWNELTDEELRQVNGNRNALASVIQQRYLITKKTAHTQIEVWIDNLKG